MKKLIGLLLAVLLFTTILPALAQGMTIVNVMIPETMEGELNGRLLFCFDLELPEDGLVYNNIDVTGCPVFGKTVYGVKSGETIVLDTNDPEVYGWPMQLKDIPEGEYAAQVLFVKYTQFTRADGSVVWGMADHGGGGSITGNPFNLYSPARMVTLGAGELEFTLDQEIPLGYELAEGQVTQQGNYADTEQVKYLKIKSELLSDFWGTEMYLGANVLLPKGYDAQKQ